MTCLRNVELHHELWAPTLHLVDQNRCDMWHVVIRWSWHLPGGSRRGETPCHCFFSLGLESGDNLALTLFIVFLLAQERLCLTKDSCSCSLPRSSPMGASLGRSRCCTVDVVRKSKRSLRVVTLRLRSLSESGSDIGLFSHWLQKRPNKTPRTLTPSNFLNHVLDEKFMHHIMHAVFVVRPPLTR